MKKSIKEKLIEIAYQNSPVFWIDNPKELADGVIINKSSTQKKLSKSEVREMMVPVFLELENLKK